MKKILAVFLLLSFVLSFSGCTDSKSSSTIEARQVTEKGIDSAPVSEPIADPTGYKVTNPMAYPDYTFDSTPSVQEMRLTAVMAVQDLLSINWSISEGISYNKTGPVSNKLFIHNADTTYAGVIYSNASTGLFQFLEFYDYQTGRLNYPGTVEEMKESLGASCADALIWGLNTVCTSIEGPYYPSTMVIKNGYYPLGSITYDESLSNFAYLPTNKIIEQNGKAVIIEAYAMVQSADILVSTPDNHGMMAIQNAYVVKNDDGSINTAESYVMIQDQRGGQGAGFYEQTIDGETILFSGRTRFKFTFDELLKKGYIPVTTAEFMGKKAYEAAQATADQQPDSFEALLNTTVSCNYPIAVVNAILVYPDESTLLLDKKLFSGADEPGVPKTLLLSDLTVLADGAFLNNLKSNCDYTLVIEVVAANGERLTPVKLVL